MIEIDGKSYLSGRPERAVESCVELRKGFVATDDDLARGMRTDEELEDEIDDDGGDAGGWLTGFKLTSFRGRHLGKSIEICSDRRAPPTTFPPPDAPVDDSPAVAARPRLP